MRNTFDWITTKLTLCVVLSSLAMWHGSAVRGHELQPTIADLTVDAGQVDMVFRVNLEALLSGIDLDAVDDTNEAEDGQNYDTLRALSADQIGARAPDLLAIWNALPLLRIDGEATALRSMTLEVPQGIDEELARIAKWRLSADLPEGAQEIVVNWPDGSGAMVLRQQGVEDPYTGYLAGGDSSPALAIDGGGALSGWQAFVAYLPVGFDHILPQGLDHILFVLGLFLLSTQIGPLLWQVTAFTLAHSVTLALGALGLVTIPGSIVEPLIAASIVYVAAENIFFARLSPWRPVVVFGFGLLHGLGFASVLGEFGLPAGQFIPALIGFNIGVEIGQLAVIAIAAAVLWLAVRAARWAQLNGREETVRDYPVMFRAVSITGSLIIALIGSYWVLERTIL